MSGVFDLEFDKGVKAKVAEKKRKEAEFAEAVRAELARENEFFAERMVKSEKSSSQMVRIWYYISMLSESLITLSEKLI